MKFMVMRKAKPIVSGALLRRSPAVILFLLLLCPSVLFAQQRTVRGRVSNDAGEPVQGASVAIKGKTTGTSTAQNGTFMLQANTGDILVVSSVNFETVEVAVTATGDINVQLKSTSGSLSEVVVVGYGQQRRKDVTGAIGSVRGETLREVPSANAVQALTGRVAGVDIARTGSRPGAGGQIRIRGNRSLSGSNDPFIVVDGIPFGGSINDLNLDDIANVDILKDASATAIYGSRGSNGVILVTTKRGRSGKPQLSINSYYGFANVMGTYDMFNASEFKDFRDLSQYSAGYSPAELAGIAKGTDTDWQDYLYKQGSVTNHELSVSGGSDAATYGIGGGYFKETGVITGQSFERFSLRATIDAKVGKRVKIGLNSLNTLGYTNGEGVNPLYGTLRIPPFVSAYNDDGSVNLYPMTGTVDATATMNPLTLKDRDMIVDRRRRLRTFNSLYGELQILKDLKYRLNVGLDFRQENRGIFNGPNTIQNPSASSAAQANASLRNAEGWTYTIEHLLNYDKTIANRHRIGFTGLYSIQQDRGFGNRVDGNDFPAEVIQYYNFNLAKNVTVPAADNYFNKSGLVSFMGRVNYVFDDRFMFTATFRRDGSSVFPVDKYLNYPAFALGWNIGNEKFMQGVDFVNSLKLRGGYGVTGNQGIPANATTGSLSSNRYNFGSTNALGYFVSSLPNRSLQWEKTASWNAGVDFGLFNDRITGSIDVYRQTTDNLLVQKSLPASNGAGSYWTNAAKTEGKGIEISLSTVNVRQNDFTWTMDVNFSLNREKILALEEPGKMQDIGNGWFVGYPVNVIYDFNKIGIWQTNEANIAAGYGSSDFAPGKIKLEDLNGDGRITDADRKVIGTFQPDWIGGMTHRFAYKNIDLSFVLFARMGGTLVATYLQNNGTGTGYFGFGNSRANQYKVDYWTPQNPTNAFPKPDGTTDRINYSSTLGYYDASFIKVRSINLGYTLPGKWMERAGLSSVRVYFSAQNPFILYSPFVRAGLGFDPEGTGTGGAVQTQGANANTGVTTRAITVGLNTPATRQFIFGLNIKL